jgi:hypothetical protein
MWSPVRSTSETGQPCFGATRAKTPFALLDRKCLIALSSAMPDAQSAVLLCLAWQAAVTERMRRGPHAGRFVARLSAPQLARLTGRPLRTVWYALRRLRQMGRLTMEIDTPGKTSVYRLNLSFPTTSGA